MAGPAMNVACLRPRRHRSSLGHCSPPVVSALFGRLFEAKEMIRKGKMVIVYAHHLHAIKSEVVVIGRDCISLYHDYHLI